MLTELTTNYEQLLTFHKNSLKPYQESVYKQNMEKMKDKLQAYFDHITAFLLYLKPDLEVILKKFKIPLEP